MSNMSTVQNRTPEACGFIVISTDTSMKMGTYHCGLRIESSQNTEGLQLNMVIFDRLKKNAHFLVVKTT